MRIRSMPLCAVAVVIVSALGSAYAEDCQNQFAIDACVTGCSITGDICGGVCSTVKTACEVACDGAYFTCDTGCDACDLGCDACCATTCFPGTCGGCRSGCDDCHDGCVNVRSSCKSLCQLDCDNCISDCEAGCPTCKPYRKIGETCFPGVNRCADGLTCWPGLFSGTTEFQCFPQQDLDLSSDDVCRAMYSSNLHDGAIRDDLAYTYGTGAAASVAAAGLVETGTVYDPNGCYGCYVTTCVGGETNLEINVYAALGQYYYFSDFAGKSIVEYGSAGLALVALVGGQVFDGEFSRVIGAVEALAFGPTLVPVTVGGYGCNTTVDVVGCLDENGNLVEVTNNAPVANCTDLSTCVDRETGLAEVNVDDGSLDPDGDEVTLTQDPPGPYATGTYVVTLTVTDPDGLSDTCEAEVSVSRRCSGPGLCGVGMPGAASAVGIILLGLFGLRWNTTAHGRRRTAAESRP